MSLKREKICVIGAGPGGMSTLFHWQLLKKSGRDLPDIVCFEKQDKWGGLWNYNWRSGEC